jgi:hypothetical protein
MNANYIAGCGLFAASKQSKDTWTLDFRFGRRTVDAGHWTNHRAQKICVYLRNLRILPTKNLKFKIKNCHLLRNLTRFNAKCRLTLQPQPALRRRRAMASGSLPLYNDL